MPSLPRGAHEYVARHVRAVSAKGRTGQISFDGRAITITRGGILARGLSGSGTTTVPIEQVTGVDFKPTGANHGRITILVAGTVAPRRNSMRSSNDPLTVDFTLHSSDFRRVRDAIETALRNRTAATTSGWTMPPPPPPGWTPSTLRAQEPSLADQIGNLAQLMEQGHLSEEEFAAAKAKLLGL
ncbi:DUF4429 domain-containing protein [Catenulispora sp. MAP5-51]|uniref:DUF4429 domain-containing protein n=1 Tax=unclassified Catenulispora TaxID=414885 RepID=UPI0035197CD4